MSDPKQSPASDEALLLAQLQAENESLRRDLEEAKSAAPADESAEVQKFRDLAARAQADLQNAKARVEREREEIGKFATESLIQKLLPTIDNFQRAIKHIPETLASDDWVKGVVAMEQELVRQLNAAGLKKIDALGQPVDPNKHEVLLTGEGEPNVVLEVLEDGYELHGKVLRPAKVKVGQ